LPEGVNCRFLDWQIEVKGPLGAIYLDTYNIKSIHNPLKNNPYIITYNTLLQNAIDGVGYGFIMKLKLRGSGYKVLSLQENKLVLRMGYSHLCNIIIPYNIKVVFHKSGQILCQGISKSKLTQFGTNLKKIRKRSPYRAKGIFEVGEPLPNKLPGKAGRK
jgi:large subunit ribosomal protein L6